VQGPGPEGIPESGFRREAERRSFVPMSKQVSKRKEDERRQKAEQKRLARQQRRAQRKAEPALTNPSRPTHPFTTYGDTVVTWD
jgi:hypothetical protein